MINSFVFLFKADTEGIAIAELITLKGIALTKHKYKSFSVIK